MFRIGQKVVYIQRSLREIGLIKNQIYTILNILNCNCTNVQHIDVGLPSDRTFIYCNDCGGIINIDDRWFFHQEGFRPVVEDFVEELNFSEGFLSK